jgi:hypothetical protein
VSKGQIYTKLHEALSIVRAGKLHKDTLLPEHRYDVHKVDHDKLRKDSVEVLEAMSKVPHYVLSSDLVDHIGLVPLTLSMNAGVMSLPFPTIAIELWSESQGSRVLGMVEDAGYGSFRGGFIQYSYGLKGSGVSPLVGGMFNWKNKVRTDEQEGVEVFPPREADMETKDVAGWEVSFGTGIPSYDGHPEMKHLIYQFGIAAMLCVMMTNISGVEREVIETSKLNKHRAAKGHEQIHTHTVVRLGHYYDKSGTKRSFSASSGSNRKPVRIHMRAAHTRNQVHGPGFLESMEGKRYAGLSTTTDTHHVVLIDAVLVNYRDGTDLEKPLPKVVRF